MTTAKEAKPKNEAITITTIYGGEQIKLEFRLPSKLVYSNAFSSISSQDFYEGIDIIIKNCFVKEEDGIDLNTEEPLKMTIMQDIMEKFFNFSNIDISTTYKGTKHKAAYNKLLKTHKFVFVVTVDEKEVLFIKPLERTDYKELFNKSSRSQLQAFNHVYQELKVGGDDIYDDNLKYVSCFQISDYLLKYKETVVKKK